MSTRSDTPRDNLTLSEADLAAWVRFALAMVCNRGGITFIHRADRLAHLLAELTPRAGDIAVFPLWPGEGKPAKRVIVQARKGVATPPFRSSALSRWFAPKHGSLTPFKESRYWQTC